MSVAQHSLANSAPLAESAGSVTLAGASATVAEMLDDLDDLNDAALFDQIAMGQRKINLRNMVSDLCPVPDKMPNTPWQTDASTALLVQAAALCARAVYRKNPAQVEPQLPGFVIKDRCWMNPTAEGLGKAAAIFEVTPDEKSRRTLVVVAVRGSASVVDWLVNLDTGLVPCPQLVNIPESRSTPAPKVHRGFANCAITLAPAIKQQIKAVLNEMQSQDREIEVVFTGYFAGGAVASLLFCHFFTQQSLATGTLSANPTLSSITFGAPPMFDRDVDARLDAVFPGSPFQLGAMLAFANDGDPIPRMDAPYATELARVWHRVGGGRCATARELGEFKLPPLRLGGLGSLVVLHDEAQEFEEGREDEDNGVALAACRFGRRDLEKRAWADLWAHKMNLYVVWAASIGEGRFNAEPEAVARTGWRRVFH
ncbi:hypothetical protein RB600_009113 [Gaeumannomyces tritici]